MRIVLLTSLWLVIFSLMQVLIALGSDTANITVTITEALEVEYTGGDVVFTITTDDIDEGSQGMMTDYDVNWWANVQPWDIYVERSDWEQTEGDGDWYPPDDYIPLRVKWGPPDNSAWQEISTEPEVWESGETTGSGSFEDVDWQIVRIGWDDDPGPPPLGTYLCTVTFSIQSS